MADRIRVTSVMRASGSEMGVRLVRVYRTPLPAATIAQDAQGQACRLTPIPTTFTFSLYSPERGCRLTTTNQIFGPPSENIFVNSGCTSHRAGSTDSTSQPSEKASYNSCRDTAAAPTIERARR